MSVVYLLNHVHNHKEEEREGGKKENQNWKKKKKKHIEFIIRNSSNSENTGKITKDPTTEK